MRVPTKKNNLRARLNQIIETMGWKPADLEEVTGASQPTVSRWLADGPIKINPTFAYRIQDASGFSARWVLLGEGPAHFVGDDLLAALPAELRDEYVRHLTTVAGIVTRSGKAE